MGVQGFGVVRSVCVRVWALWGTNIWEREETMRAKINWNGGRNGWASFLLGFGWMPGLGANATSKERRAGVCAGNWAIHIYLGPWVLTLNGVPESITHRKARGND